MKKIIKHCGLLFTIMLVIFSSCVKEEYDIDNLNTEITIGESGIALPIGSTDSLKLSNFLKDSNVNNLERREDGSFSIVLEDNISLTKDILNIVDIPIIKGPSFKFPLSFPINVASTPLNLTSIQASEGADLVVNIPKSTHTCVIYKGEELPEEFLEISKLEMEEVILSTYISANNIPFFGEGKGINLDLIISFSDVIKPSEFHIKGNVSNEEDLVSLMKVEGLDFSNIDLTKREDISVDISISGKMRVIEPSVISPEIYGKEISLGFSGSSSDIQVDKIQGRVDYTVNPIHQEISLNEFPDFLRKDGVTLDVDNPHIEMDFTTNLGVPVVGELEIVGYKDGELVGESIKLSIDLPYSDDGTKVVKSSICIGNKEENIPEGAIFYQADLASLLKSVPERVDVTLVAHTNKEKYIVLESNIDYVLDLGYKFVVPLSFGKDFRITFSDTISVANMELGNLMKYGDLILDGIVSSTLPVKLDMNLNFLDSKDYILPIKEITQAINACKQDGSETTTPLRMELSSEDGADLSDLSKIKVDFVVTSGNVSGVPITDKSYIRATLSAILPNGLTLDLAQEKE